MKDATIHSTQTATKSVTFERENITIRLICNESSTAAVKNLQAFLHEILSRMLDRDVRCEVPSNSENASVLNR